MKQILLPQPHFLQKYRISEPKFNETTLNWKQLEDIFNDYMGYLPEYEKSTHLVSDVLRTAPKAHSTKYRTKDPEHLIEKIIRKTIEEPSNTYEPENYKEKITDLAGVRVLHLYKEDWENIHNFILSKWHLHPNSKPTANVREGDETKRFSELGCKIKIHPSGYRSIHYLITLQSFKQRTTVEVQVRTVFEEGWSEIDHDLRYPYELNNEVLKKYLMMFNRLAGSADEMGSFIKFLKQDMVLREEDFRAKLKIRDQELKEFMDAEKREQQVYREKYKGIHDTYTAEREQSWQEHVKKIEELHGKKIVVYEQYIAKLKLITKEADLKTLTVYKDVIDSAEASPDLKAFCKSIFDNWPDHGLLTEFMRNHMPISKTGEHD